MFPKTFPHPYRMIGNEDGEGRKVNALNLTRFGGSHVKIALKHTLLRRVNRFTNDYSECTPRSYLFNYG